MNPATQTAFATPTEKQQLSLTQIDLANYADNKRHNRQNKNAGSKNFASINSRPTKSFRN